MNHVGLLDVGVTAGLLLHVLSLKDFLGFLSAVGTSGWNFFTVGLLIEFFESFSAVGTLVFSSSCCFFSLEVSGLLSYLLIRLPSKEYRLW